MTYSKGNWHFIIVNITVESFILFFILLNSRNKTIDNHLITNDSEASIFGDYSCAHMVNQ